MIKMNRDKILFILTIILLLESLYLAWEIYFYGYTNKSFMILGFMFLLKLGQIQTVLIYNK